MTENFVHFATNPANLLLLVALTALLESLAFVGILVPGVALLLGLASLAGQQSVNLYLLLAAGFCGAALGDVLSFFAGRHAAPAILRVGLIARHPHWIDNSKQYFHRYGVISVILGRFIGPVRPVMPFVAGMCNMHPGLFISVNLLSALFWSPVYLLPGYFLGYGSSILPQYWLDLISLLLPLLICLLLFHQTHRALQPGGAISGLGRQLPVPQKHLGAWFMLITSLLLFFTLAYLQFNSLVQQWNHSLFSQLLTDLPWFDSLSHWLTRLGDPLFVLGVAAIVVLLSPDRERRRQAAWFSGLLLVLLASNQLLKLLFAVDRPATAFLDSYSFPSTHAALSSALYLMLAVYLGQGQPGYRRRWFYTVAMLTAILIGISRILLGLHWPLDVLAGLALGLIFTSSYRLLYLPASTVSPKWRTKLVATIATWILFYPSLIQLWTT